MEKFFRISRFVSRASNLLPGGTGARPAAGNERKGRQSGAIRFA